MIDQDRRTEAVDYFGDNLDLSDVSCGLAQPKLIMGASSSPALAEGDLNRLRFLPELMHVEFYYTKLTDNDFKDLRHLHNLRVLLIYSDLITDYCLKYIAPLKSLQRIDMQNSQNITRSAFNQLVGELPNLVDVYSP